MGFKKVKKGSGRFKSFKGVQEGHGLRILKRFNYLTKISNIKLLLFVNKCFYFYTNQIAWPGRRAEFPAEANANHAFINVCVSV